MNTAFSWHVVRFSESKYQRTLRGIKLGSLYTERVYVGLLAASLFYTIFRLLVLQKSIGLEAVWFTNAF
jgi:hypothetical protein